jgi:molybdopterin/thiamine biosynthesis adenylyltransferase
MGTGGAVKSITLIGAGGNIGSHLVPHLGRMPGIGRVTLIDRDVYEERNLVSQDILPGDIGRPKAMVQARRLRAINPRLHVIPLEEPVENLPLGVLRADVILAALDSRRARQCVNEIAWRLKVPWCDSGVRSEEFLARITVYVPGEDVPCLECAWSDSDYEQIEQIYPCQDVSTMKEIPTNAPSCLGALAASMQALECCKILEGRLDRAAVGRQITIDSQWHNHYEMRYRRNPDCRFDHKSWNIKKLPLRLDQFTLEDALGLGDRIELDHRPFVKGLLCPGCGSERSVFFLSAALNREARRCTQCGTVMTASGFDTLERIDGRLPQKILNYPLNKVGFREGDVFHAGDENYFEITGDVL